jgi:hypothetical protein
LPVVKFQPARSLKFLNYPQQFSLIVQSFS